MNEKGITIDELKTAILKWWQEHQYDITINDGEEYNNFDEEPEFVRLAKKLNE